MRHSRKPKERTLCVEALDPHTNQMIAQVIPVETYGHEGKTSAEGAPRSVWEFPPILKRRLIDLLYLEEIRVALFVENEDGELIPFGRERIEALA